MRLKHECPAPAKFGSAEPLWKSATIDFLKGVKDVVTALRSFGKGVYSSDSLSAARLVDHVSDFRPTFGAICWNLARDCRGIQRSSTCRNVSLAIFTNSHFFVDVLELQRTNGSQISRRFASRGELRSLATSSVPSFDYHLSPRLI